MGIMKLDWEVVWSYFLKGVRVSIFTNENLPINIIFNSRQYLRIFFIITFFLALSLIAKNYLKFWVDYGLKFIYFNHFYFFNICYKFFSQFRLLIFLEFKIIPILFFVLRSFFWFHLYLKILQFTWTKIMWLHYLKEELYVAQLGNIKKIKLWQPWSLHGKK